MRSQSFNKFPRIQLTQFKMSISNKRKWFSVCFLVIFLFATNSDANRVFEDSVSTQQIEVIASDDIFQTGSELPEMKAIQLFGISFPKAFIVLVAIYFGLCQVILLGLIGIALEMPKVRSALIRPIGPCIIFVANWIFVPSVRHIVSIEN